MNTENNKQKKKRKLHEFIDIKKEEILEEISKALWEVEQEWRHEK